MKNVALSSQSGFSIVELMVGLTLGALLMVFVVQLFMQNKIVQGMTNQLSVLKTDAVFAQYHINYITRLAGYRSAPDPDAGIPYGNLGSVFSSSAPYISVTDNDGTSGSDTLTVRYQGSGDGLGTPDNLVSDCLNTPLDAGDMATNVFTINDDNALVCEATNETAGTTTAQPLAQNVENFQVLLGEDIDGDFIADRYVTPDYSGLEWSNVTAVRFSLLLKTKNEVSNISDENFYNLLGEVIPPANDRHLRRVVTKTVQLRNVSYVGS